MKISDIVTYKNCFSGWIISIYIYISYIHCIYESSYFNCFPLNFYKPCNELQFTSERKSYFLKKRRLRTSIIFGLITEVKTNFPYMSQPSTCYLENGVKLRLPIFKWYQHIKSRELYLWVNITKQLRLGDH